MPGLSVWYVRTALVYLALGLTFGMLMLWHKGMPIHPALWALLPAHIEFLLLGWTLRIGLRRRLWILPRFRTKTGQCAAGLAGLCAAQRRHLAGHARSVAGQAGEVGTWGASSEGFAVIAFALHAWPRIQPPAHRRRPWDRRHLCRHSRLVLAATDGGVPGTTRALRIAPLRASAMSWPIQWDSRGVLAVWCIMTALPSAVLIPKRARP